MTNIVNNRKANDCPTTADSAVARSRIGSIRYSSAISCPTRVSQGEPANKRRQAQFVRQILTVSPPAFDRGTETYDLGDSQLSKETRGNFFGIFFFPPKPGEFSPQPGALGGLR